MVCFLYWENQIERTSVHKLIQQFFLTIDSIDDGKEQHRRFGSGLFGKKKAKTNKKAVKPKNVALDTLPSPLPTEDVYGKLVHWTLVEGNLNKSAVGHTLQLWIQRDPNADPIIDIVVVNQVQFVD